MPEPNPPYYVRFAADAVSSARVDRTQTNPGGAGVDRAGHTHVAFPGAGTMSVATDTGAPRADGMIPFFFRSVNIHFVLTDFEIQITSDYPPGSCAERATMGHEVSEHIVNPTRIMYAFRDPLIAALNAIPLPTERSPRWIPPGQEVQTRESLIAPVRSVVRDFRHQVSAAMHAASQESDSADHYRRVFQQCTARQWRNP
ncbi:MAG: hypothetical protein U0Q16_23790 [Bryobacteraceae bacterium]